MAATPSPGWSREKPSNATRHRECRRRFANAEYHGLEGIRRSTALYRALFDDLAFDVVDQIAEADRIASRWVLTDSNRGRTVRLSGITLSHLRDGRSVEDWTSFDSLELSRQLDLLHTLLAAPLLLGAIRDARRS